MIRRWLAERLDPESYDRLDDLEWATEFLGDQNARLQKRDPICSLYRDGMFLGYAKNYGQTLLLITELSAPAFVSVHAEGLDRPTGMVKSLVFKSAGWDPDHELPRYDFYEVR